MTQALTERKKEERCCSLVVCTRMLSVLVAGQGRRGTGRSATSIEEIHGGDALGWEGRGWCHERCSDFPHRSPGQAHFLLYSLQPCISLTEFELENISPHLLQPAPRCSQFPTPFSTSHRSNEFCPGSEPCTHLLQPVQERTTGFCCKPPVWWYCRAKEGGEELNLHKHHIPGRGHSRSKEEFQPRSEQSRSPNLSLSYFFSKPSAEMTG